MADITTDPATQSPQLTSPAEPTQVTSFQDFQDMYNKATKHVDLGHQAEIKGDTKTAILNYSEGLQMIKQILLVECGWLLDCSITELSHAKEQQDKMILVKVDVSGRLKMLQSGASHSKDQTSQLSPSPRLLKDSESDPYFLDFDIPRHDSITEATEIFTIPNAILMFGISTEGVVNSSSKYCTLHVVKFDHGFRRLSNGAFIPPAFLQVEDWLYPLMPGLSPALITKYRTYIFPDVLSEDEGAAVAIVFPQSVPRIERMKFEVILDRFTVLDNKHIQKEYLEALSDMDLVPRKDKIAYNVATIIAFTITAAASLTVWIITTGAFLIIWLLQLAFGIIRSQIKPVEEPSKVDPNIRQGVTYVKTATTATVKVKQYIVDKLGECTMSLALAIAPILMEQGEKILPAFLTSPSSEFVRGSARITSSTVKGMTRVCKSLDFASMSVMNNLTQESFDVIHHRFGEDVGTFASETLSTAQCVVRTARSAKNMNLMRFAARAGKPRGKAVLHEHSIKSQKGSTGAKMFTPISFVRANAILHNSTLIYVKILETIGRSKMGLRKRSSGSSEGENKNYRRGSVDGVLKTKTGNQASYYHIQRKGKLQGKRFSIPATAYFDTGRKSFPSAHHRSANSRLTTVASASDVISNASKLELVTTNEKLQGKEQAKTEKITAPRRHSDGAQGKITKRRGSVYTS